MWMVETGLTSLSLTQAGSLFLTLTSLEVLSRGVLFPVLAGKDPYLKTPLERHWGWWSVCGGEDKLMVI